MKRRLRSHFVCPSDVNTEKTQKPRIQFLNTTHTVATEILTSNFMPGLLERVLNQIPA